MVLPEVPPAVSGGFLDETLVKARGMSSMRGIIPPRRDETVFRGRIGV